ncbi:unnamed protein product [Calypogeia fissa]
MERPEESEWESMKVEGEEEEDDKTSKEADLDMEVWRCLNSVNEMLCQRQILNQTLRKGWMELASARYQMGPARISQTLFSLKPQAAKAAIEVSPHSEGEGERPVLFELVKDSSERQQRVVSYTDGKHPKYRKLNSSSQLRRRQVSTPAVLVEEKDELLQYANLIDDSDSEDDVPLEVQKSNMQGFGAMVAPHLRNAQGSFVKALQNIVELLNAQSNATDAHSKAKRLQASIDSSVGQ